MCDAMLGGLARWLRAAGYDAWFDVHARDGELVRRALEEHRWLLTSDSGILERFAVSEGLVRCVFVPPGLSTIQQLSHVMRALDLKLRDSRCMDCGGELIEAAAVEVEGQVPKRVQDLGVRFYRCAGCAKVYWRGTHWESIQERLRHAMQLAGTGTRPGDAPARKSDEGPKS